MGGWKDGWTRCEYAMQAAPEAVLYLGGALQAISRPRAFHRA